MEEITDDRIEMSSTIIYWGPPNNFPTELDKLCSLLNVDLIVADCVSDIVVFPSFLTIIDPQNHSKDDMSGLSQWITEWNTPHCKVLLISEHEALNFPARNLVRRPKTLDNDYLKFLILRTRSKIRGMKAKWERTERRIVRLMYMVRLFDCDIPFKVSEIASEFDVSKRTIQRDISVLEMANYPILRDSNNSYSVPIGYKLYEHYYNGKSEPEDAGE